MIIANKYPQARSSQQTPLLRASTRYMETLQKVQPVVGGGDIVTFLNVAKNTDLYTTGTNNLVFRLRPSKDLNAPYLVEDLKISTRQISLFLPLEGDADRPAILGLNSGNLLTLSTYKSGSGYQQAVFQPGSEKGKLKQFKAIRGASGNIYVTAVLEDDTLVNNFFSPVDLKWKSDRWVPVQDPDGATAKVRSLAIAGNDPVQNALFAIGASGSAYENKVLFSQENFAFSSLTNLVAPVVSGHWGKIADISVIQDSTKLLNIFAVENETGTVWVKKQKKNSVSGKTEFDEWKLVVDSQSDVNVFGVRLKQVQASVRFDQVTELFCTGEDDALYYTRQLTTTKGVVSGWSPLFSLGHQFSSTNFTVARNLAGYSEVYSVTTTNELIRYTQSPETTQWFENKLYVDSGENQVISVPTHSIDLTVLDGEGVPQPNAEISLSASYQVQLSVNGLSYLANAMNTLMLKTDVSGRLSILQNANGLAGATLYIETPFTGMGEPVILEPNLELQGKIQKTTAADVLNAKDRDGNFLLQEKDRTQANAESLASVMQASMGLADTAQMYPVVYFYKQQGAPKYFSEARLNIAANADKNWQIDFSSGFPVYSSLSREDVLIYRANVSEGGFLGIDWSDVWDSIKGGFNKVVDGIKKIVFTITDKVKVLFEIVVNGVSKFFEAVAETVQQLFNIVEGVWNWLKVTAAKLYEWLAFFFSWPDIKRTAEVVEYSTNLFLDFTKAAVEELRSGAESWIDGMKDDLKKAVDEYLAKYGDNTTLGEIGEPYKKPNPEAENAMDHNPLFGSYKENYKNTVVKAAFVSRVENSPINELVDKLLALTENFTNGDGKQAFEEAIAYFSNIKENPDRALELLLSGLIKVGESIALFTLDFGKLVILFILDIIIAIIDAFKELMNEEWEIPIVSDIYKYITGSSLSFRPIRLLSYFVAIPSTLIYKLVKNEAPFADAAAVQNFKDYFTLGWLKQRAGLGPVKNAVLLRNAAQESVARTLFKAGYAVSMFTASFADIAVAIGSSLNTISDPVGYVSTGAGIMAAVFTNPWIVEVDPGKLTCSKSETTGNGSGFKLGYIASALGPLKSAAVFLAKKMNPAMPPPVVVKLNEISSSLVGAVQCIMYVVEFVTTEKADPKVFARTLTALIPGKLLRFLSLSELNTGTYFIPVGILSVLTFGGYTSAFIINFTIDDAISEPAAILEYA